MKEDYICDDRLDLVEHAKKINSMSDEEFVKYVQTSMTDLRGDMGSLPKHLIDEEQELIRIALISEEALSLSDIIGKYASDEYKSFIYK